MNLPVASYGDPINHDGLKRVALTKHSPFGQPGYDRQYEGREDMLEIDEPFERMRRNIMFRIRAGDTLHADGD